MGGTRSSIIVALAAIAWTAIAWTQEPSRTTRTRLVQGEPFVVTLENSEAGEVVIYTDASGRRFTREEMKARFQTKGKLSPELVERLASAAPEEKLHVVLILTEQPTKAVVAEARARHRERWDSLRADLRELNQKDVPAGRFAASAEQEREWAPSRLTPGERERKVRLLEELDALDSLRNREIGEELKRRTAPQQERVAHAILDLGGETHNRLRLVSALAGSIPAASISVLATLGDVRWIDLDGLLSTSLDDAVATIGADTSFWAYGYDGQTFEGGVLDTGINATHPAFSGKTLQTHISLAGAETYDSFWDNAALVNDLQGHGTMVSGIVCGNDTPNRGVAFHDNNHVVVKCGWRDTEEEGHFCTSDVVAGAEWALFEAADDADVFNLSGGSLSVDDDDYENQVFDAIVDDLGTTAVFAAGNEGRSGYGLHSPGICYNGICVGNIDNQDTSARSDDAIDGSSSHGPTRGYRRKPDLGAPGTGVDSAYYHWEIFDDYVSGGGTSSAAPMVAGACLLLADYGIVSPLSQKALLLNTAEDVEGRGVWNDRYGHGEIDLDHAWYHRTDVREDTVGDSTTPSEEQFKLYKGRMGTADRATLVTARHVGYGSNYYYDHFDLSVLVLSLHREDDGTAIDADSCSIDNTAHVTQGGADTVDVVVKVTSFGPFPAGPQETFALATEEGFEEATIHLRVRVTATATNSGECVLVTVTNGGNVRAHDVEATVQLPGGWVWNSGHTGQVSLGDLDPGAGATAWLSAASKPGTGSIQATAESRSYQETFSGQGSVSVSR